MNAGLDATRLDRREVVVLVVMLAALSLMRWQVGSQLPLSEDEAYYTAWSLTPDWGYWTKPPMIAWAIGLCRELFGPTLEAVRVVPALAFFLCGVTLFRLVLDLGGSSLQAWVSTVLWMTTPLVSFYGLIATTDSMLMLFWLLAMRSAWQALQGRSAHWIWTGLWVGLGLLSKYSMVLFGVGVVAALLHPAWRWHWRSPWLYAGGVVASLVFAPNLWWNFTQGAPTLHHTAQISGGGIGYGLRWMSLLEFWLAQWAVTGLVALVVCGLWLKSKPWRSDAAGTAHAALWVVHAAWPMLLVISIQALFTRAHANWAAPALISVLLGAAWWMVQGRHVRWFQLALALHVLFMAALYGYDLYAKPLNIRPSVFSDPFWTLRSWPDLNRAVINAWWTQASDVQRADWRIASEDRGIVAQVQATLNLPAGQALGWQLADAPDNHFEQRFPIRSGTPSQQVLLITRMPEATVLQRFPQAQHAQHVIIRRIPDAPVDVQFWWLKP